MKIRIQLLALLLVCLSPTHALAWNELGTYYLGGVAPLALGDICDTTSFPLTPGDCSGTAGNPDWDVEIATALARWQAATTNFQFVTIPDSGASNPGSCDPADVNSTFFLDDICGLAAFDPSTLAVALTSFFFDGVALHSDVIFNTAWTWDAFDDALSNHGDDIDIRRVAVHEFGHVMGLGHTSHVNAIMAPFIQETLVNPTADDLAGIASVYGATIAFAIPDQNGNSAEEYLHVRRTPAGAIQATIRDGATGALYKSLTFLGSGYQPIDAALLPDEDGNGAPELAVLSMRLSDLRAVVQIRNIAGAENTRQITYALDLTPVRMINIGDADTNGVSELAVLAIREVDLAPVVQVRNSFGPVAVRNIYFTPFHSPLDMEVIFDPAGIAPPRLAVLMMDWSQPEPTLPRGVVEMRNAFGSQATKRISIRAESTPVDLAIIQGSPQMMAVLSTRDLDGVAIVETQIVVSPFTKVVHILKSGYAPLGLTSIDDADGDGKAEIAVLTFRASDGRTYVQMRNVDKTNIRSFILQANLDDTHSIFVTEDLDGDTFPEINVLRSRQIDARMRIDGANAAGPNTAGTTFIWMSPP